MITSTGDFLKDITRWTRSFISEKKTLNRSKNTIAQYTRILDDFYDFSTDHEDYMTIQSMSKHYILEFLQWKEEKLTTISPTTKQTNVVVLKSFMKFITDNNDDNTNLMKKIGDLKVILPKKHPSGLNDEEYIKLLLTLEEHSDKTPRTHYGRIINNRNSLITKLLLFCGLRASEVINVKFSDATYIQDEDVYSFKIKGKGDKERFVFIEREKIEVEFSFLSSKTNMKYISETKSNKLLDRKNLYSMLETLFKNAGIQKRGVHILRHTFAQRLVQENVNLGTIQDLLGHSNIQTTMIYAKTNEKNKIKAIKMLKS